MVVVASLSTKRCLRMSFHPEAYGPGVPSSANAWPSTNGSQLFPWLQCELDCPGSLLGFLGSGRSEFFFRFCEFPGALAVLYKLLSRLLL